MSKWGLTREQRTTKPWGLEASLLQPAKVITDPVHGDIYLTALERRFLDSPPVQRLRRVRQLGTTQLVYPGATHSRFSHSLGALCAAQQLLNAVIDQRQGRDVEEDLFTEWERTNPDECDKRIAEATILARCGALLHDLCHVPFGHTVEDDLGVLDAHDHNEKRFESLWSQLPDDFRTSLGEELARELRRLILSKASYDDESKYPFVADIVGNTICADLIDYLQRDHYYTGLPARLGHRFIDSFYVTPSTHPYHPRQMVLRITRGDNEIRADAVSELFKYLRYRYELSERALVHHAKLAADAMVGKLLEMWRDSLWVDLVAKEAAEATKASRGDVAMIREKIPRALADRCDDAAKDSLEKLFLTHGDDGLLEHIRSAAAATQPTDSRREALQSLATDLLNRQLYKRIATCRGARASAKDIFDTYGGPEARRKLERDAARFAGLKEGWHVVLWIPKPDMRLKAAGVLVDDGRSVAKLEDLDRVQGKRGREIYESHEALWAIQAYAHATLRQDKEKALAVLAFLARELRVVWDGMPPEASDPVLLAVKQVVVERELAREREDEIMNGVMVQDLAAFDPAHANAPDTFAALKKRVATLVEHTAAPAQRELL